MINELNIKLQNDYRDIDDYLEDNNLRFITENLENSINKDLEHSRQKIREFMKENNKRPTIKDITKITGISISKIRKLGGVNKLIDIATEQDL